MGTKLDPYGDGTCPFGKHDTMGASLCSTINTLGIITIGSALILSVSQARTKTVTYMQPCEEPISSCLMSSLLSPTQGLLLLTCGAGAAVAELIGRLLLSAAWLATAILATVFGAKAGAGAHSKGGSDGHPDWLLSTIMMCWAMFLLSLAMVGGAGVLGGGGRLPMVTVTAAPTGSSSS